MTSQDLEPRWLAWAKRLQAIASTGSHFHPGDFDAERYAEIAQIANAMLATLGNVPIERIEGLVSDFARGYSTPKIDVRGAVIDGNSVLLVKERSDGLWTLPGGYADVGISAAENVVKEVYEEAGIAVAANRLYAVFHKSKHAYDADTRDFYKFYFLCDKLDDTPPIAGLETAEVAFFRRDRLPALSRGRVIEQHIDAAFEFHSDPRRTTLFD